MGKLTMFDDLWKPLRRSLDAQYFLRCGSSSHCEVWKPFTYPNKVYISSMGDISQFKQATKKKVSTAKIKVLLVGWHPKASRGKHC